MIIGNLEQDLENKSIQIAALQTNLSSIATIVLDLQKRLSEKFPDEFPIDENPATTISDPSKRTRKVSSHRPPVRDKAPPFENSDQLIDEYLNSGNAKSREKLKSSKAEA